MTLEYFVRAVQDQIRTIECPQLVESTDVEVNEATFHFKRGDAVVTVDHSGQIRAFTNFGPKVAWRTDPRPMDLASARLVAEFFATRAGAANG
jgi:hypothetical protein